MLRRLRKSRGGTAEIVGTVLFLVILFFFFSNVFLWHNQVTREMDQLVADKTNSAVRIETTVLEGTPDSIQNVMGLAEQNGRNTAPYSLAYDHTFKVIAGAEKMLIADLRVSINASFSDPYNESCFVYIWDFDQGVPVNTGLMVMNGYRWSNATLPLPISYIDQNGNVKIEIVDASSQLGYADNVQGVLNIVFMQVCADWVALKVINLGGSDAILSRLWVLNSTDHTPFDLNETLVAGGSARTIIFSILGSETTVSNGNDIVIDCVPSAGQTVTFRVLTTLGNTAACSIDFPG